MAEQAQMNTSSTCYKCKQIHAIYPENNGLCLICTRKLRETQEKPKPKGISKASSTQ